MGVFGTLALATYIIGFSAMSAMSNVAQSISHVSGGITVVCFCFLFYKNISFVMIKRLLKRIQRGHYFYIESMQFSH